MGTTFDENETVRMLADPDRRREAFGRLIGLYSESLYWKVRRIVLTHDDANDVLQNALLKAWNSLDDFHGKAKISTWLYRIAINEALDFVRRQKNKTSADADLSVANSLMADSYFDGDEAQALLQEAISRLPDVQRTVFNLRYFDNMKYSEMSQVLGTTEGALKASYHIAVQKISDFFRRHD